MGTILNFVVVILILLFLAIMFYVILKYWRSNNTADKNKVLDTFDGIGETDAPPPKLFFISMFIAFAMAVGYLILYPGLGNWKGLVEWQQSDDKLSAPTTTLDHQMAQLSNHSLSALANVEEVVRSGEGLFQTHCAACHRDNAQGQKHFPNLIDNDWLYGGSDAEIIHSIKHGRNGAMPGWEEVLSNEEVTNVSYYLAALDNRHINAPSVKIAQGKETFIQNCSSCHHDGTVANPLIGAPLLSDDIWLHGGSIEEIQTTIRGGLNNVMPAFGNQLSDNKILAIGAYLNRSKIDYETRMSALDQEQIKRGEYLAYAGDCVACHSSEGGEPFAGGLPFVTPFGTAYSTNITPHVSEGIGDYNYQEFKDALYKGKGKHGYLYPAMPYTSYQYVTEEDVQALWAYLQSITPVAHRNSTNQMMFPSNIRLGLLGWNIVFMDTDPLNIDIPTELNIPEDKQELWQRGKYFVMGLGHCSECHTPRNLAQALESDKIFQGNIIDGWNAPNITANELYEDAWDLNSLSDFLHTAHSDKGTAFAGMADVVKNSTSKMTRDDVESMAYYLLKGDKGNTLDPTIKQLKPSGFTAEALQSPQYALYKETCGACHGADGKGRDPIAPTLLHNGIIMHSDPFNTIAVAVRGLSPTYIDEERNFMPMVSFEDILSDKELADMISFVRYYLGDRKDPVTEQQVTDVRERLEKAGYTQGLHSTPDMYEQRDGNINVD
ncbi:c-type cytochrome [Vibrio sp. SS-MA-C1-2]|uniref:c-type cytochrome n=1 Tax=Vibrio sp. SS-MA-C1-2 TaxID=2908646 RepID=UPI001F4743F7|nr:c-type cytochrome [Vibrio sp. SS-MA-C1-2]UJF19732.1 c-type cytochrome [Vibrio sp. SS-MA-C1-2]